MLDLILVKLPFLGLDPSPFNGKAVGVQSCRGEELYILFIAVIVIACNAARLGKAGMRELFLRPVIAVNIVTLYLMCGRCRAEKEPFWKTHAPDLLHLISCRTTGSSCRIS